MSKNAYFVHSTLAPTAIICTEH